MLLNAGDRHATLGTRTSLCASLANELIGSGAPDCWIDMRLFNSAANQRSRLRGADESYGE